MSGKKPQSFREVGESCKMDSVMLERYVRYMQTRWGATEGLQCDTGYAAEWAARFISGNEYNASDSTGQRVLKQIERQGLKAKTKSKKERR